MNGYKLRQNVHVKFELDRLFPLFGVKYVDQIQVHCSWNSCRKLVRSYEGLNLANPTILLVDSNARVRKYVEIRSY